jgi:hypothetical protein
MPSPIAIKQIGAMLRLLGPPHERQRRDLKRLTDVVLIENGAAIYWPRTGELFPLANATYALARVQATLVGTR